MKTQTSNHKSQIPNLIKLRDMLREMRDTDMREMRDTPREMRDTGLIEMRDTSRNERQREIRDKKKKETK